MLSLRLLLRSLLVLCSILNSIDLVVSSSGGVGQQAQRCNNPGQQTCSQTISTVGNVTIFKFPTSQILDGMIAPPASNEQIGAIPSHLQYTVCLDQVGGFPFSDPEAAVSLSSGTFETDTKRGLKKTRVKQKLNRCRGGGWGFLFDDITTASNGKTLLDNGKESIARSMNEKEDEYCFLAFEWNVDFTKAKITGYVEERPMVPMAIARRMARSTIKLTPYWAWKFGLSNSKKGKAGTFDELDAKCCPPRYGNACQGAGTIGKLNTACETISMACGQVAHDNLAECAMWTRHNKALGVVPMVSYVAYPIGDKNRDATGFFPHFEAAMESSGIHEAFYGLPLQKKR